ncbi:alpha/beta fold hydrolase [Wukongibacter sp. M2B1]|uniref:alpha/beta fold hydrolase n=1 Tax=Wukongibacter sp. M2B1 TaxID=3088895 RepID=UPI003D7B8478
MSSFVFPFGYTKMHHTKVIDYQLNRWHSLGYTNIEDMKNAAKEINKVEDWKAALLKQAELAYDEGRLMNATFNYRAAEFFVHPDDPDKNMLYNRFIDMFYNELFKDENLKREWIPYNGNEIPALKLKSKTDIAKDTLVIHGGFDSFMEELYSCAFYFTERGYDVILFEGPGQGAALKDKGIYSNYRWEKPVKAVLDHYKLDNVTIIGFSMGGWFCFRAAAYEPRIKRVIASSIAYDYMKIPPKPVENFARWLFKHPKIMNVMTDLKMKMMPQEKWGVDNLMYITGTKTPLDAGLALLEFNEEHLKSEMVKQDVLILTGEADHFIPVKMHRLQVAALKNAKSIKEHIFTEKTQAHNHCMIGNTGLMLETMASWLELKKAIE